MVVKSPMPFPQVPFCTSEVGLVVSIPYLQTIILKELDLLTVATMHESSTLESLTFTIKLLRPGCAKTIFFSQTFQNDFFCSVKKVHCIKHFPSAYNILIRKSSYKCT